MRHITRLLVLVLILGSSLSGAKETSPMPEIIDYYRLMSLSDQDRVDYLFEISNLLKTLEKNNIYFSSNTKFDDFVYQERSSFIQWLISIQPAHAANSVYSCKPSDCPAGTISRPTSLGTQECIPSNCSPENVYCSGFLTCKTKCICSDGNSPKSSGPENKSESSTVYTVHIEPKNKEDIPKNKSLTPESQKGIDKGGNPKSEEKPQAEADKKTEKKKEDLDPVKPAEKKPEVCEPRTCPEKDASYRFKVKDAFNKRVETSKDARCINGGLIGQYSINGRKKCEPITQYQIGKMKLTCSAGQTLCNPLLFGLKNESPAQPFCVPIGVEMTEKCFRLSGGPAAAKNFWKHADLDHETISAEWDKLRKALTNDLCNEKASAEYHCKECAIIAKRLRGLNKWLDKCPSESKCGETIKCAYRYENSIKKLEQADTKKGAK